MILCGKNGDPRTANRKPQTLYHQDTKTPRYTKKKLLVIRYLLLEPDIEDAPDCLARHSSAFQERRRATAAANSFDCHSFPLHRSFHTFAFRSLKAPQSAQHGAERTRQLVQQTGKHAVRGGLAR
jgi:hypothetical protein